MSEQIHARARKFLQEFFSDEELTNFCFDYFPQVYNDFTTGMPKSQKVRMVVENSQRRGRFDELLAALERERPKSYPDHFAEQPQQIDPKPKPTETTERNPRQIFISHAHQDAEFAQKLAADLRANGWQTWMAPDNIRPGEKWVEAINRGLSESGVFVLLLTPDAVASRWVKSEMNVAIGMEHREEIRLLPLNLKSASTPALWQAYQWIGFDGNYNTGLTALLSVLYSRKVTLTELIKPKAPSRRKSHIETKGKVGSNSQGVLSERIKTMPTYWFYAGGGLILLLILLVSFWPERDNGPVGEPTEVAEVIVTTTEGLEATNIPQPIPSETPTRSTPTVKPTEPATNTVAPSVTPALSLTPSPILAGDAVNGEQLFNQNVIGTDFAPGCIACHSLERNVVIVGPSQFGVGTRAETTVDGLTAEEYLRQSIVEPDAYIVEGYVMGLMHNNYEEELSDVQINDLVAFLLTLK